MSVLATGIVNGPHNARWGGFGSSPAPVWSHGLIGGLPGPKDGTRKRDCPLLARTNSPTLHRVRMSDVPLEARRVGEDPKLQGLSQFRTPLSVDPLAVPEGGHSSFPLRISHYPAPVPLPVHKRTFQHRPVRKSRDPVPVLLAVSETTCLFRGFLAPVPGPFQGSRASGQVFGTLSRPGHTLVRYEGTIPDVASGLIGQLHPALGSLRLACTGSPFSSLPSGVPHQNECDEYDAESSRRRFCPASGSSEYLRDRGSIPLFRTNLVHLMILSSSTGLPFRKNHSHPDASTSESAPSA